MARHSTDSVTLPGSDAFYDDVYRHCIHSHDVKHNDCPRSSDLRPVNDGDTLVTQEKGVIYATQVDYDLTDIPASYDAARDYDSATLAQWLEHICSHVPNQDVSNILDVGCGTGRFSKVLADQFNASVIGIDPSEKMLEQARKKHADSGISFLRAPAERIPLDDSSVDMVFMSMVYHHLFDQKATAEECRRILKSPGYVVLRNSTSNQEMFFPYINIFPGVRAVIRQYQPSAEEVISLFLKFGFRQTKHEVVTHNTAQNWHLFTEKIKRRADSILARLPEADFKEGVRALEAHAADANRNDPVTVNVDLFVFRS